MSKWVQRAVALVVMLAVVLGATVWGSAGMVINYEKPQTDAPVVMTINGEEVHADEYAGYMQLILLNTVSTYQQYAQMFGMEGEYTIASIGKEMGPYLYENVKGQIAYLYVARQKLAENGLEVPFAARKALKRTRQSMIDQLGGEENYLNFLAENGFSDLGYCNMSYSQECINTLGEYFFGENGAAAPSEEELMQYFRDNYLAAKHILISMTDSTTGEQIRTEEEAKAEAQKILDRLHAGEDFDALMQENSEDPGLSGNPDGYIFTEGEMVTAFYDAAKALGEDEVSGLVKSDYGYHIIKRVPVDYEGQFENYKNALTTAVSGTIEDLMNQWIKEADVQTTEVFDQITYQNLREYLPADVQARLAAFDAVASMQIPADGEEQTEQPQE